MINYTFCTLNEAIYKYDNKPFIIETVHIVELEVVWSVFWWFLIFLLKSFTSFLFVKAFSWETGVASGILSDFWLVLDRSVSSFRFSLGFLSAMEKEGLIIPWLLLPALCSLMKWMTDCLLQMLNMRSLSSLKLYSEIQNTDNMK